MNRIVFPLKPQTKGPEVADLQTALQLFLDRRALLRDDETARRRQSAALQRELASQTYGNATRQLVALFQKARGLRASGAVNESTAHAINDTLRDWGLLDQPDPHPPSVVRGQVLEGRVVLEHGLPAAKITLRLYRRDFGGAETRLAETTTNEGGLYALPYEAAGKRISLEVRAVDAAGKEVPLSKALYDISNEDRTAIDLVAPTAVQPLAGEYERLAADLRPYVGDMKELAKARENPERQDLTVLNRATGWDARLIALAAKASTLGADADVGLSQEVLYGLFRAGLPSDKLQLAQVAVEAVSQALATVDETGIVKLTAQQLAEATAKFETFALNTRLKVPAPGSRATYDDLLYSVHLTGGSDPHKKFASIYLNHRGDGAALWKKAGAAGIPDPDIQALQRQGKLAFLTRNNLAMTTRLHADPAITDPVQLVEQDFDRAEKWIAEIDKLAVPDDEKIPLSYVGETFEKRKKAYADDMARKVRLSYPTHVVARMIDRGTGDVFRLGASRAATATLLNNAVTKGFRLGQTPVETFLKANPDVLDGIPPSDRETAKRNARILQRVYQITPSNDAMPVLMELGLTSAYDIVEMSQDVFLSRYDTRFPSRQEAELVYRKAQQVSSVIYNLFTIAKNLDSQPPVYGMSGPAAAREAVKGELIKQFPTMESLFGSLDFCECEHCRSVLSPAAYFVDLLQFIDAEQQAWANFLDDWKQKHNGEEYTTTYQKPYDALIARRPDIPHIRLTCENTHTTLPYIDIVNEILEYYVANGRLDDRAAHDTGDATTAELLVEPQNVVSTAYDTLQHARYPLTLPFDLWLETVRAFCEHVESPLWRMLEHLRQGDELFALQPYDRAAIFMESLGLARSESAILADPNVLAAWHELYGYASATEATTEGTDPASGQRIDLNSAKALSRRLGVTYKELVEIIRTGFVNPKLVELAILDTLGVTIHDVLFYKDHRALLTRDPQTLSPNEQKQLEEVRAFEQRLTDTTTHATSGSGDAKVWLTAAFQNNAFDDVLVLEDSDASCNFDGTTLRYPFRQVEGQRAADAIAFLRINVFVRVWRKLGWTIDEIDHALQTFVPKNAPFDAAHLGRSPLKTALIYLAHLKALDSRVPVGEQSRLKLLTLWSPVATTDKPLGLTADEIGLILSDAGRDPATADLSLDTVSLLHRHGVLAKGLKLSVRELIALKQLSGLDPFKALSDEPLTELNQDYPFTQTLRFVDVVEQVKDSGLTIVDLEYLLRHRFDPTGKYRPNTGATLALLKTLANGIRAIRAEHAVPTEAGGMDEETLRQKLGLALPSDVVNSFLGAMHGTAELTGGRAFFEKHLQKQVPGVLPARGFLDAADFDLFFGAGPASLTDTQREERFRGQRIRLAQAFLPFLQQRLVHRFIVETIATQLTADPALVEALVSDAHVLSDPQPLLEAFTATAERGVTTTFFDETGSELGAKVFEHPDTALTDKDNNPLKPDTAKRVRFEGYLEAPTSGAYRFFIQFDKKDAEAALRFDHLADPFLRGAAAADDNEIGGGSDDNHAELKAGVPYPFTFDATKLNDGNVRLLVQGETLPKGNAAQLTLYPETAIERADRALLLLRKVLQLIQGLNLTEREIRYLLAHGADFGNLDLSKLPARPGGGTLAGSQALFRQFLRLAAYARLKRDLAGETDDLIDIFETETADDAYVLLAKVMRRGEATVKETAGRLFAAPRFTDERAVRRLWEALQIAERFGAPVAAIVQWTKIVDDAASPDERFAIARDVKEAVKARLEPEGWPRAAQPIFDKLRQRQRDALAAHVMRQCGFARLEQLYEHFLIDPGMEPVVQTSRIRLALGSVQLFIQRCLLNLEEQVHPSVINAKQWEWMKRYRVWEANRKIFLFPENWLEPEFRDDKTHLFSELEGTLLQSDVSNDLVEDALLNYLKKLEELARLDIVAMHLEHKADPVLTALHVIGRTHSAPHRYFYRRYANQLWTSWEPVSAEIEGDHVAPVVWRERLYLFWVTFIDKPHEGAAGSSAGTKKLSDAKLSEVMSDVKAAGGRKRIEMQLHWSQYLQGEWSTRESGGFVPARKPAIKGTAIKDIGNTAEFLTVPLTVPMDFDPLSVSIHVSKEPYTDGDEGGVFIHLGGPINQAFYMAGRNSPPERASSSPGPPNPYSANDVQATRYLGTGSLTVEFKQRIAIEDGKAPVDTVETPSILQRGGSYTLVPCDNAITLSAPDVTSSTNDPDAAAAAIAGGLAELASLTTPFFYQDKVHTFFVEPDVAERTIEEWQEWVTRTPQPDGKWDRPDWWKEIVLVPEVPRGKDIVDVRPQRDWLVNPTTGLLFNGEIIGPAGRAGLTVLPSTDVPAAVADGGMPVNIRAGSGLASGSAVVAVGGNTLEQTGLTLAAGGLTVVGSGGLIGR